MNALERIGLLKMDFLGLTTLTVLDDAVRMIKENRGVDIDLAALQLDDAKTYALFSRGDTTGIFQFESHGMRDILRRYQPTRLEDFTALNALYRPGPIQGGMIDDFIARKHGKKKVAYDLPELEGNSLRNLGRHSVSGTGDADRQPPGRIFAGRCRPAAPRHGQKEARGNGRAARKIPDRMRGAQSYRQESREDLRPDGRIRGLRIQQIAFLRLRASRVSDRLAESSLSGRIHGRHAQRRNGQHRQSGEVHQRSAQHGHSRLAARCERERLVFHAGRQRHSFRPGAIKNVGENTAIAISKTREESGNFHGFFGFCEAVESKFINKRVLESLTKAGAFDCLGKSRGRIYAAIDQGVSRGAKKAQAKAVGQDGLFLVNPGTSHAGNGSSAETELPPAEDWTEEQQLAGEYAILGFYISGHPLDKYAGRLKDLKAIDLSSMESRRNGEDIVVAGIIVQMRPMRSRRGARWAIFTLQDRTGVIEALAFPEAFGKLEHVMKTNTPLLVKGRVAIEDVGTRLIVADARLLDQVADQAPTQLRVRVDLSTLDSGALDRLHELFGSRPGRCKVSFDLIQQDGTEATLDSGSAVQADRELVERVREICGTDSVAVVR